MTCLNRAYGWAPRIDLSALTVGAFGSVTPKRVFKNRHREEHSDEAISSDLPSTARLLRSFQSLLRTFINLHHIWTTADGYTAFLLISSPRRGGGLRWGGLASADFPPILTFPLAGGKGM